MDDKIKELEKRISRQEYLHRQVGDDGNIVHYWSALPMVIIGCAIGVVFGIFINKKII
jgi:hypothetical protein